MAHATLDSVAKLMTDSAYLRDVEIDRDGPCVRAAFVGLRGSLGVYVYNDHPSEDGIEVTASWFDGSHQCGTANDKTDSDACRLIADAIMARGGAK